ncbi:AMP-binding protein [Dietzia aurantiaca]|uniref:class I adenylate-forming enzyme family protein n=1 Tax=Dietzia aurantiaca TaxID=983873 RepID=UPI001E4C9EFC|nr:AMP-binding protein [Dietzia aurantiaca]MCD2261303.1 AMP-binding protein [Dietzia aurantiaca]
MNAEDENSRRAPVAQVGTTHESVLAAFQAAVAAGPKLPAIHYFDTTMSWQDVDRASDAVAALLAARGFSAGDRLALCVQNNPAFVIGLLATWKARGTVALVSPMSKRSEFALAVEDLDPTALLCLDDVYEEVARHVLGTRSARVPIVVTVSPLDFQTRDDLRMFDGCRRRDPADTIDLARVVQARTAREADSRADRQLGAVRIPPNDVAVIAPTSGTTGAPKGAMLTHRNLLVSGEVYRDWSGLVAGEPVLAMSPLFHVTGLVGAVILAMVTGSPIVLTHRFGPTVIADAIEERRPAFGIAAITAYKALAAEPTITAGRLAPLRIRFSGGLPIDPDVVDELDERLGGYIHNAYGQTETASPSHLVPYGQRAPTDPDTGVLSVGIPVPGTTVAVVDEAGLPVPPGAFGEIMTSGPQVMAGYWRRPDATADALGRGMFATGDIGFVDDDGWLYVVDRSSDVINAAGYKIWPYEVEQVLSAHPAVEEVAVVDIADEYRGQSARAYVALRDGEVATAAELIEYCRARMAAYKYPREVEIVDALPRTATGKILRRRLRES